MSAPPRLQRLFVLGMVLLAAGCRTGAPQLSYYALSAEQRSPGNPSASAAPEKPAIGIGAVALPQYLDRPQMVVRTGPHQLRVDDYHLWASPLAEDVARVLAENLMLLTQSPRVARLPWGNRFEPDIVVGVQIFTFEAQTDGRVLLKAAVTLKDRRSNTEKNLAVNLEEQAAGGSYEEYVAAQSRMIGALSRRIAETIVR